MGSFLLAIRYLFWDSYGDRIRCRFQTVVTAIGRRYSFLGVLALGCIAATPSYSRTRVPNNFSRRITYESVPCKAHTTPVAASVPGNVSPDTIVDLSKVTGFRSRALTLVRRPTGAILGVIRLPDDEAAARRSRLVRPTRIGQSEVYILGPIGPKSLQGILVLVGKTGFLLMHRETLQSSDAALMASAADTMDLPVGYYIVSYQDPVQVPGIGSTPVSLGTTGWVASYTGRDAQGDQTAVAAARVELCRSKAPLEIYRWWYNHGRINTDGSFTEVTPSEAGNGLRRITATNPNKNEIIVVATYYLTPPQHAVVVQSIHEMTTTEIATFRPPGGAGTGPAQ